MSTSSAGSHVVEVEGLRKVYSLSGGEELIAVDDVDFRVARGGALGIVGESGSGKTTIARMLAGLIVPTAGRITIAGRDRSRRPSGAKERRRRGQELQIVFQDPYTSLDPRFTVAACIDEVLRLHFDLDQSERSRRIDALMDQVGLDERQRRALPRALSGGQRQRVAIARALAAEPEVLLLDEAVSALDVSIQAQILNLLRDLRATTGTTLVFISHDLAVVRQVADETLVLQRGAIVERGPTDRVLDDPQHAYTKLLRASVPGPGWTLDSARAVAERADVDARGSNNRPVD